MSDKETLPEPFGFRAGNSAGAVFPDGHGNIASVDASMFKSAMSKLAAGVSVLTCIDKAGQKMGIVVTSLTSVSLNPPLVLVCIDNRCRMTPALMKGVPFNLHILKSDHGSLAQDFARHCEDKFLHMSQCSEINCCPRLPDVLVFLECYPHQTVVAGDHVVVVGRVVNAAVANHMRPLVYYDRGFTKL